MERISEETVDMTAAKGADSSSPASTVPVYLMTMVGKILSGTSISGMSARAAKALTKSEKNHTSVMMLIKEPARFNEETSFTVKILVTTCG